MRHLQRHANALPAIVVVPVLPQCEDVSEGDAISDARVNNHSVAAGGSLEFESHGAPVARTGNPTVALR